MQCNCFVTLAHKFDGSGCESCWFSPVISFYCQVWGFFWNVYSTYEMKRAQPIQIRISVNACHNNFYWMKWQSDKIASFVANDIVWVRSCVSFLLCIIMVIDQHRFGNRDIRLHGMTQLFFFYKAAHELVLINRFNDVKIVRLLSFQLSCTRITRIASMQRRKLFE